jgi:hypothetical protein
MPFTAAKPGAVQLAAEKGERTEGRLGYRSGYYQRALRRAIKRVQYQAPRANVLQSLNRWRSPATTSLTPSTVNNGRFFIAAQSIAVDNSINDEIHDGRGRTASRRCLAGRPHDILHVH